MTPAELNVELFHLRRNHLDSLIQLRRHILRELQNKSDQSQMEMLVAIDKKIANEHLMLVQLYGSELGIAFLETNNSQAVQ